ncbi:enoyl-CoA hydratase [Pseudomonas aeruginosa]|uniref:enoyl-CoA hydratase n=1 Tax=Pseudomonas aeruginosa TaxID=287 RepID=UPI000EB273D7|nr:enoyl-CoA hydratase [Pseudomonas aeruginosa]EIU1413949.1 enoyl-CoA hydratase [Pseudomonas aeruginosa]MCG9956499.1 enoyl-CoA hydratase [Pseudomonas aeruginosa]RPW10794.1 enoyl-CoA hydratase [Pseudomonas aeruginosa]RTB51798.1 enoyl-CoA hydratase [Pseudomonas aeruginosa]RTC34176.1 enoyl-CoA hydratase [Pseudomonas aeruginosa]
MSDSIKISENDGVLEIIFARPEKKNALSSDMYRAAREALEYAHTSKSVRVILFGAEGEAFTAGNDIADFLQISNGSPSELQAPLFIRALGAAEKPIVAAVQGLAVGVGTTLILHCDLVFIAETAKLSAPFVNLGLVPEAASSGLMPDRIGHVRAFAMFALGETISGSEAFALGLANKVLPQQEVLTAARSAAKVLAQKPIGALTATKMLMRDVDAIASRMEVEGAVFAERLKSDEAKEAFSAFAERRAPEFSKFS